MRKRAAAILSGDGWQFTDHVCRFCAARVLTRADGSFHCSTCSASSLTGGAHAICGCGMHLGPLPKTSRERSRRENRAPQAFRCTANNSVTETNPALFVIAYLELPAAGAVSG